MRNIVTRGVFIYENLAVFEDSKWTIYAWWLMLGTVGSALGGVLFSPRMASPWWILPAYLAAVAVVKKSFVKVAQRVFPSDFWWQVTSIFLTTFLLACIPPGVSLLTSNSILAVLMIVASSLVVGFLHTAFRVVFTRDHIAWVYAAAPCATVAAFTGWFVLRSEYVDTANLVSAAIAGAIVGAVYTLLTTLLLQLMWDPSATQSFLGTAAVDKDGEFEQALEFHARAIALKPNNPKLYATRADTYIKQGDLVSAWADISHALSLDPKCAEARLLRAVLMADEGNLDGAIAEYDQLVNHKWGYQDAYLHRARAYSQKGDYDRALADYELASKLGEDAALTFAHRAETYYQMGDYDRAIADCGLTMSTKTMTPIAWTMALLTRGKCYAAKGDDELASRDFVQVLEGFSAPNLIKEAEDGLSKLKHKTQESTELEP
jgi:tetratricopeptide (TPR) repeat protein